MKTPIAAETGVATTGSSLTTTKLQGARIMADSDNSRTLPPVTLENCKSVPPYQLPEHHCLRAYKSKRSSVLSEPETGGRSGERRYS
ncbi:hypothetical protein C5748_25900 [Phyllobacterium phragmitis]|uniref:Uncharacterized protein n=1 Tax=Phyllobacterium phragmitis TaxID=2670329 RepID=A0A2S9IJF2_9HYPH|nr:hypothetical protein C5748_25900 [Phyllobacterium phragmitis]